MSRQCPNPLRRPLPWLTAALIGLAAVVPAGAGEIYEWKDANGVTQYSDSPPPEGEYRNREISNEDPPVDKAARERAEQPPAQADDGASGGDGEALDSSAQCATARGNLERLASDAPVGLDADGDGEPDAVMDEEQRAEQTQLAEAAVQAHCTDSTG